MFEEYIKNNTFGMTEAEALNHNVLVFAFVGDAVFTLFVRDYFASSSTKKAGELHTKTSKIVKASFQAKLIDELDNSLTEREKQICKTARNTSTHNIAKNSNLEEYKKATSFESLIGYLYLTKQDERLKEILEKCKQIFQNEK